MMSINSVISMIVRARWSLGAKATRARFWPGADKLLQATAPAACRAMVA
jgi:hypothetical protein